jgi:hypothetical protein
MTIAQIADYFGIDESTFYRLKNRDSRFFEAYQKGEAKGAANALWEKIR